ncbi:EF-hand domain-containing protein [Edaphovirga cremea]|uniref:EF-hand domain-containing protein n=1 Tax=Edaphovirga cremea TaxID=2267246 RepID=UPI0013002610|nr:EF-hand domain-containing protein [Edaphovirga cremea]
MAPLTEEQKASIRERFAEEDLNHDGYITVADFKEFLNRKGGKFTEEDAAGFLEECDFAHDGKVTLEEVLKASE